MWFALGILLWQRRDVKTSKSINQMVRTSFLLAWIDTDLLDLSDLTRSLTHCVSHSQTRWQWHTHSVTVSMRAGRSDQEFLYNCLMFPRSSHGKKFNGSCFIYQALTLSFCIHWPGRPVDLKSYWPPKKVTGPNIVKKICRYRGAHRFRRPSFDRSDIMKTSWSSYVACFFKCKFFRLQQ